MKNEQEKRQCPQADTHFASDKTADTMYELSLFRERIGLTPVPDRPEPYRRPELRPMAPGKTYRV